MNVICLVVDRLHAGYLGCYGNTGVITPELNRLAAEAFLFNQATIDSPELASLYRSWWRGRHALEADVSADEWSLPTALAVAGMRTTLVTDDPQVVDDLPEGAPIERIVVESPLPRRAADEAKSAHMHAFFDRALDWLDTTSEPFMLWMHTATLGVVWDAPTELRQQYVAEEDATPAEGVAVPHSELPEGYDPDELLAIAQAYSAQVTLLDEHIGHFLECLRDSALAKNTLFILVGARGLSMGEHRLVGAWDNVLHGELVHVPWLMRFPDGLGMLARSQALVQPADLPLTIAEWCNVTLPQRDPAAAQSLLPIIRGESTVARERACVTSAGGERGIRTRRWYLRQLADRAEIEPAADDAGSGSHVRQPCLLYSKPDDLHEVNEVFDRCTDIGELLADAYRAFAEGCQQQKLSDLPPLDGRLNASHA